MQWDGSNENTIRKWSKGRARIDLNNVNSPLFLGTEGEYYWIAKYDWVVKDVNGGFCMYNDCRFKETFEPIATKNR